MDLGLKDKVALVTGAGSQIGFGRAIAVTLAKEGCNIISADMDVEGAKKTAEEVKGLGVKAIAVKVDISKNDEVQEMVKASIAEFGKIDILVNNAGILSNNKVTNTSYEEWDRVLKVNLSGAFYLSKALIPGMKERKWGRIVNTCSLASKTGGITAGTAYSTSKGALVALTFSLAAETASFGITVNGIAPAYVRTPMVTDQLTESQREQLLQKIPVHRFCEPEEFVHVVKFLVHPLAGFITGEIIDQNGGLHFD